MWTVSECRLDDMEKQIQKCNEIKSNIKRFVPVHDSDWSVIHRTVE